jgi:hypothetical protein
MGTGPYRIAELAAHIDDRIRVVLIPSSSLTSRSLTCIRTIAEHCG